VGDDVGYLVLTPLRTSTATVLVVRGFISSGGLTGGVTAPAPPSGPETIVGRVMPAETASDKAAQLPVGQINSINTSEQASRLGAQVYDGYVELSAGQPGTQGLVAIPEPDLSNPAGGAAELQHLAYVLQWFLFAALALAAPIVMARAERRRVSPELDDEAPITPSDAKAARLADRYGRPAH
jgi:cytochrome oxidase assembly protein ShyY1